eukprot:scpid43626/ scgid14726/ 
MRVLSTCTPRFSQWVAHLAHTLVPSRSDSSIARRPAESMKHAEDPQAGVQHQRHHQEDSNANMRQEKELRSSRFPKVMVIMYNAEEPKIARGKKKREPNIQVKQ